MPDRVEHLEPAAGDELVGVFAVVGGDDGVASAPDDEDRQTRGEVQAVAGVDALTTGSDDRAQRGQEGGSPVGVGERRIAAADLGDVRVGP